MAANSLGSPDEPNLEGSSLAQLAAATFTRRDSTVREVLDALPVAVYITDAAGRITYFNEAAAALWGRRPDLGQDQLCGSWKLYSLNGDPLPRDQCSMAVALKEGQSIRGMEAVAERPDGTRMSFLPHPTPLFDTSGRLLGAVNLLVDTTVQKTIERDLRQQTHRLETLNRIAKAIASELNLERIVQTVTDAATDLSGAKFGAFFYNVVDEQGERYTLYTISGVPRAAFERFGLPRNTAVFDPTFRGVGTIRSDDIRADPRYGRNSPHHGMPKGHLPVVSYLAVPVISRSGEVHGGLFFGHEQRGVFTKESEEIVEAIAAHAAIAIDNARLLQAAQREIEVRRRAEHAANRFAAIVESSEDGILGMDLNGVVTSWNKGAERLYGYEAQEVIGKSVTIIVPTDRPDDEERAILARIQRGEHIDHYETVRRRKDGSSVEVSLSLSPIKNEAGEIIGASKIARDITERRRAQEQQQMLLREMDHRIKNLFAVSSSVVSLSARAANIPSSVAGVIHGRLGALSRAHALTLSSPTNEGSVSGQKTTLHALIRTIVAPYLDEVGSGSERVTIDGADVPISGSIVTNMALLLHEFATNAAKYGALSTANGRIEIQCSESGDQFILLWQERGGPRVERRTDGEGFGSLLTTETVQRHMEGQISRNWDPNGLTIRLAIRRNRLSPQSA